MRQKIKYKTRKIIKSKNLRHKNMATNTKWIFTEVIQSQMKYALSTSNMT